VPLYEMHENQMKGDILGLDLRGHMLGFRSKVLGLDPFILVYLVFMLIRSVL